MEELQEYQPAGPSGYVCPPHIAITQ